MSHNGHLFFLQGTKTVAYETGKNLRISAPDSALLVAAAGSNILGCDIAFSELFDADQIAHRLRLLGGQPEHRAPPRTCVINTGSSPRLWSGFFSDDQLMGRSGGDIRCSISSASVISFSHSSRPTSRTPRGIPICLSTLRVFEGWGQSGLRFRHGGLIVSARGSVSERF
ncbi:hypothetical protein MOQ72_42570 [Saccharopolyspora sp. K220]|uniref:hypothetical protein n=1 Tax=Saccharopolyspora soli TaxID=2926618 RepID=UPI001F59EC4A|nr:hypothetical protein [Saccharopolyspora soli]MCI2424102.1 hypothetical protein [Saccharopolyspora soli]